MTTPSGAEPTSLIEFSVDQRSRLDPYVPLVVNDAKGRNVGRLRFDETARFTLAGSSPVFSFGSEYNMVPFALPAGQDKAVMYWDGSQWWCNMQASQSAVADSPPPGDSSNGSGDALMSIGVLGLIVGLLWALVAFNMETSLATGFLSTERVVNIDLVQRRNLHFGAAGLVIVCSVMTLLASVLRKASPR